MTWLSRCGVKRVWFQNIRPGGNSDLNLHSNVHFRLARPCDLQPHVNSIGYMHALLTSHRVTWNLFTLSTQTI
jgi:hypothetical protein